NETDRAKYILPVNIAKFDTMFKLDFVGYEVSFNSIKKYANSLEEEVRNTGTFELPNITENIDMDVIEPFDSGIKARVEAEEALPPEPFEYKTFKMNEMEDIPPKLHRTGEIIDLIDSTYTDEGGQYGGVVTIVTGESGSGKTTLLIDKLTKYKKVDPNCKVLYISTEMTRGDLRFYKMNLPAIGIIDTLLVLDYMRKNQLRQAVEYAFNFGYDIIVLDSLQDLIGKLTDTAGMRPSEATRFVVEMMIDSAENKGTAVLAIQHLTKGGTYVGSSMLKHTTTAMLHLKFDNAGRRYAYYSKNRRGGDMQKKPIYFDIDKETQQLVYDVEKFNQVMNAEKLAKDEQKKKAQSMQDFYDIIGKQKDTAEAGTESDSAYELHMDDIAHPELEPEPTFGQVVDDVPVNDTVSDENIISASQAMSELAEDIEFIED
ncbi:MAG: hypothetical protein DRJ64_10475, partial [Thermoprotei archaeon]